MTEQVELKNDIIRIIFHKLSTTGLSPIEAICIICEKSNHDPNIVSSIVRYIVHEQMDFDLPMNLSIPLQSLLLI